MTTPCTKIIFTDLDGTLLDHETYQWKSASEALEAAQKRNIPIVPCTSKTLSECFAIQQQLGITGPLIYENGAGVALPKEQFKRQPPSSKLEQSDHWICNFSTDYDHIRDTLANIKKYGRYVFKGFGDMSVGDVSDTTGLSVEKARQAKDRRHSEPIIWLDDAKTFNHFHNDIRKAGLSLVRGGRFIHVLNKCDKGQTLKWVAKQYARSGLRPQVIALGDSPNDIPMLQAADIAIIVKNPQRGELAYTQTEGQTLIRTEAVGPAGWNESILKLINKDPSNG